MYVLAAILASLLVTAVPAGGQGAQWCYRSDKSSPAACVFPTMDQCARSAAIMGGLCERAQTGPVDPGPRRRGTPNAAKKKS